MTTKALSPLKAKPLRNPGQSLDEALQEILDDKLLPYFFLPMFFWLLAGLEWFAVARQMPRQPVLYALTAVILAAWGVRADTPT